MNRISNIVHIRSLYFKRNLLFYYSIISSFVAVFYTYSKTLIESLINPVYLWVWALTFIQMLIVAVLVGVVSSQLDQKVSYYDNPWKRWIYQIFFGVFLVSLINAAIVYYYNLLVMGIDMSKSGYFARDFVIIVIFTTFLNFLHYHMQTIYRLKYKITKYYGKLNDYNMIKKKIDQFEYQFATAEADHFLYAHQFASVFIEKSENLRIIQAQHLNGKIYTLTQFTTLQNVIDILPELFERTSRDKIENRRIRI